jgi:hypothetical protein
MSGIKIGDRLIQRISGPVSFRLLRPVRRNDPLVMLLGDEHNSFFGQCSNCTCKKSMESCCYRSYDPEFLQLLDLLASPKKKIKIFVEAFTRLISNATRAIELYGDVVVKEKIDKYGDFTLYDSKKVNEQLPSLYAGFHPCFLYKQDPAAYNQYCPTRNIEWHFADARMRSSLDEPADPSRKIFKQQGTLYKHDFELLVYQTIIKLFKSIKNGERFEYPTYLKPHVQFIITICEAITTCNTPGATKIVDMLFNRSDSLVAKEAKKASGKIDNMRGKIIRFVQYLFKDTPACVSKVNTEIVSQLPDIIDGKNFLSDVTNEMIEHGQLKLVQVTSWILDIYFICRVLKSGDSWLNLLFAGDEHCKNISVFLVDICKLYTRDVVVEKNNNKRCLDLGSIYLDLNKESGIVPRANFSHLDYKTQQSLDKERKGLLSDLAYMILYDSGILVDKSLLTETNKDPTELIDHLKLQEFVRQFKALDTLRNEPVTSEEAEKFAVILCSPVSEKFRLTETDIKRFFNKGWIDALKQLVKCESKLASQIIVEAIALNKVELANHLFVIMQDNLRPDLLDPHPFVEKILKMLAIEAKGLKVFKYDVFDAYFPILSAFRGQFAYNPTELEKLINTHPKFREAMKNGRLKYTFDSVGSEQRYIYSD